jgi:hypothetical protein
LKRSARFTCFLAASAAAYILLGACVVLALLGMAVQLQFGERGTDVSVTRVHTYLVDSAPLFNPVSFLPATQVQQKISGGKQTTGERDSGAWSPAFCFYGSETPSWLLCGVFLPTSQSSPS